MTMNAYQKKCLDTLRKLGIGNPTWRVSYPVSRGPMSQAIRMVWLNEWSTSQECLALALCKKLGIRFYKYQFLTNGVMRLTRHHTLVFPKAKAATTPCGIVHWELQDAEKLWSGGGTRRILTPL